MQISKAFDALTGLLPSSSKLLKLARKCRFVMRRPRKIWPDDILRAVVCAVAEATPCFRSVAAKLGEITEESPSRQAVFERLSHEAAPDFFWGALLEVLAGQWRRARSMDSGLDRLSAKLASHFGRIIVEDSSVVPLHASLAGTYRGSANQFGEGASLRLRWAFDLLTGWVLDSELRHWRENDQSTAFDLLDHVRERDLVLRDMGYFSLECLQEIEFRGAWWLTRLPEGTLLADAQGQALDWIAPLRRSGASLHEWEVRVGRNGEVRGRLVAARIDPAKAAERRRELRKSLRLKGRVPTADQLALCDWVVVCTNAPADVLPAAEAAQLYRGRWMVEIFFKGLKSGQGLEVWSRHRTNANAILCMAYSHLILAVLSLNLWRVLGRIASLDEVPERADEQPGQWRRPDTGELRTVGMLMALPLLMGTLLGLLSRKLKRREAAKKLCNDARYSTQEKRKRPSLDAMIFALLA